VSAILFLEQSLNGVQFGLMLFLLAAGLTLVFGIMDMINLAHGSLYMIGAYFMASFVQATGSFWLGLPLALLATAIVGAVLEMTLLRIRPEPWKPAHSLLLGKLLNLHAGKYSEGPGFEVRFAKPKVMTYADLYARLQASTGLPGTSLWRRMMVLGPSPDPAYFPLSVWLQNPDNAVRYSPKGERVEVRVNGIGGVPTIQVDDAGPGIPPSERERVFDRFYRRAANDEPGTGLGLALVRSIAARHRADVSLGDSPLGGLRATVRFS